MSAGSIVQNYFAHYKNQAVKGTRQKVLREAVKEWYFSGIIHKAVDPTPPPPPRHIKE